MGCCASAAGEQLSGETQNQIGCPQHLQRRPGRDQYKLCCLSKQAWSHIPSWPGQYSMASTVWPSQTGQFWHAVSANKAYLHQLGRALVFACIPPTPR